MIRTAFFALLALASPAFLHAEEKALAAPTAPAVRRTASAAAWTVFFLYKDEKKQAPDANEQPVQKQDRIKSQSVKKTQNTYSEETQWVSGKKDTKWQIEGLQFQSSASGVVALLPRPESADFAQPDYTDFSSGDFPELAWVTLEDYRGIGTHQGKPCYLFVRESGGKKLSAKLSEFQLPLEFDSGDLVRVYTMNPPPAAPLTPPDNFLRTLTAYKQGKEALKRQASPP